MEMKFNESQLELINHDKGYCLVNSTAGSGKSTSIIARIEHLVNDLKINPSKITLITFTRNSADDLVKKLENKGITGITVGTYHSICGRILSKCGKFGNNIRQYEVDNMFFKIINPINGKGINCKEIMSFISYQKNFGKGVDDKFEPKKIKDGNLSIAELRACYKAYEEYKKDNNMMDMDDVLIKTLNMFKTDIFGELDEFKCEYLIADEEQDANTIQYELNEHLCPSGNIMCVGDINQCFTGDTLIKTLNGYKKIEDITIDDDVIVACGRGETYNSKPSNIIKNNYSGKLIKIELESGDIITCTPNHTVFANSSIKSNSYVYLMYRPDYGFRIGISRNHGNTSKKNGYEFRCVQEHAKMAWCIKVCDTIEESLYWEKFYAFNYGIPLYPFESEDRSLKISQEKTKELFNSLNTFPKAIRLLNDLNMYINHPHFRVSGNSEYTNVKTTLTLFGSHRKSIGLKDGYVGHKHELEFSTKDDFFVSEANKISNFVGIAKKKNGFGNEYYNGRWTNSNQDYLTDLGDKFTSVYDNNIFYKRAVLTDINTKMDFMVASNVRKGMTMAILKDNNVVNSVVKEVSFIDYDGYVYDINIPMYRNYFANNICVHNCLYSFRGANPKEFLNFSTKQNCKIINMNTNYRCSKKIVDFANSFSRKFLMSDLYVDAIANKDEEGHIYSDFYWNDEAEAFGVANKIEELIKNGVNPKDIAVLFRLNKMSQLLELELKEREIPYYLDSSSSFFNLNEIQSILCLLRLIINPNDDLAYQDLFNTRVGMFKYFQKGLIDTIRNQSINQNSSYLLASQNVEIQGKPYVNRNLNQFFSNVSSLTAQYKAGVSVKDLITNSIRILDLYKTIDTNINYDEDQKDTRKNAVNIMISLGGKSKNLHSLLEFAYTDNKKKKDEKDCEKLQMMSIHKSKGLEFDNVFVIGNQGCGEGNFPHKESKIEDESCLFFVAVTRAINNLYLSEVEQHSIFIKAAIDGCEYDIDKVLDYTKDE